MDQDPRSVHEMDEKTLLVYVLKNLLVKFNEEQVPSVPLHDRLTFYTGLPLTIINKVISEKPKMPTLSLKSRILLNYVLIKHCYADNTLVDYFRFYEEAIQYSMYKNKDYTTEDTISYTDFIEEIILLGYEMKKTSQNMSIILENPEVRFERYMYLSRIQKLRTTKKQIVYIDERLLSNHKICEKMCLTDSCLDPESDTVFYHAVSRNGYISGLESNQANYEDFLKWVKDILLGRLKSLSIIIMDSNPLHGIAKKACPITRHSSKQEMLKWLIKNCVPCSNDMSKPELYELICKFDDNSICYEIDNMIRSHGHEIIRLPRFYHDLSMTTPLWEYVIKNFQISGASTALKFKHSLLAFIQNIQREQFIGWDNLIGQYEKELFKTDTMIESVIDKFNIIQS